MFVAKINFSYRHTLPSPVRWQKWDAESVLTNKQTHLETVLNFPAGTLAVLHRAFALGLDRNTGWQCALHPAITCAARYFKRGVMLAGQVKSKPVQGACAVYFSQASAINTKDKFAENFVLLDKSVHALGMYETNTTCCVVETNEQCKTLETVAEILQRWRACGEPQRWLIIGGGVLLDIGVYTASIVGVSFALMPTTLLAMLDACVGGKSAVNFFPYGKNQVGSFYFAECVFIYQKWLQSLQKRELIAGSWEAIKHALIAGNKQMLHAWLFWQGEISTDTVSVLPSIQQALAVKIAIVQEDTSEANRRRLLNLGHTLAHALESVAQDEYSTNANKLLHGEAVGIGLVFAVLLSEEVWGVELPYTESLRHASFLRKEQLEKILAVKSLSSMKLWQRLQYYFLQDKKCQARKQWVLIDPVTHLASDDLVAVSEKVLRRCWLQLCHDFLH